MVFKDLRHYTNEHLYLVAFNSGLRARRISSSEECHGPGRWHGLGVPVWPVGRPGEEYAANIQRREEEEWETWTSNKRGNTYSSSFILCPGTPPTVVTILASLSLGFLASPCLYL
jgi:hypothetical protein